MVKAEQLGDLPPELRELVAAAQAARARAYAPYSSFFVGAAVQSVDGRIFTGANVENASYGLAICAERSAVIAAVMAGAKALRAAAVCSDLSPPAAPCGMCRQTLTEFASDCEIVLCGPAPAGEGQQGEVVRVKLSELLPRAFSPASLHAFAQQQRARGGDGSNG